ncbi:TPA: hypothetical protein ACTXAJ_005880 [Raoultella planticola]
MNKIILIMCGFSLLTACADKPPKKDKLINDFMNEGMNSSEAMIAYQNQYKTELLVNTQAFSGQDDYAQWIYGSNLQEVANMIVCPKSKNAFSYRASAVAQPDGVHIVINRSDCQIDIVKVSNYLNGAIKENKDKESLRIQSQNAIKQTSSVGPFVIGCQDYQRKFKGQKIYSVSYAINKYPQINSTYVINLYNMGHDIARYHGPFTDCEYLAAMNLTR